MVNHKLSINTVLPLSNTCIDSGCIDISHLKSVLPSCEGEGRLSTTKLWTMFLAVLALALFSSVVSANQIYFTYDYPQFMDINQSELVEVTYKNATAYQDNTVACIYIQINGTTANMTYNVSNSRWYSYLTETTYAIDFPMNITAFDSVSCTGTNMTVQNMARFRHPFYVTVRMYKSVGNDSSDLYKNDFSYVYFQLYDYHAFPQSSNMFSTMTKMLDVIPFYESKKFDYKMDTTQSFWGEYNAGSAIVKLYEVGNYSLGVVSADVMGNGWRYEYIRPQQESIRFDSKLAYLTLDNPSNVTLNVHASRWEISKMNFVIEAGKWIMFFAIWFLGLLFIPGLQLKTAWGVGWWILLNLTGLI